MRYFLAFIFSFILSTAIFASDLPRDAIPILRDGQLVFEDEKYNQYIFKHDEQLHRCYFIVQVFFCSPINDVRMNNSEFVFIDNKNGASIFKTDSMVWLCRYDPSKYDYTCKFNLVSD